MSMRTRPAILMLAVLAAALSVAPPTASAASPVGSAASAAGSASRPTPDAVVLWNVNATRAAVTCGISPAGDPLTESRTYAMMHLAVHDALNTIRPRYRSSTGQPASSWANRSASPEAAVAAAASSVLLKNLPCASDQVRDAYALALATVPDGPAEAAGVRIGEAAAKAIDDRRGSDGSAGLPVTADLSPQGTRPGEYRYTPDQTFVFQPQWGTVRPFGLRKATQFSPTGPYDVSSARYARDLNEIRALGGDDATGHRRTADQTQIALYWVNSSPLQWNSIARTVLSDQGYRSDLWDTARLFAWLNTAMADGYIASFADKYLNPQTRLFWRPVTAIRGADRDGNRFTAGDPDWTPLRPTPPIPDYDSAHAVEGGAAATVLAGFFGDRVRFSACSVSLPESANACAGTGGAGGVVRVYGSFSVAAQENADSRVYVGFHFRKATEDGLAHGHRIGGWTVRTTLGPVR